MISKFTSDMLDRLILEFKKNENMEKVQQNLIDPLIYYSLKRMYPYLLVTFILFILTFLLALLILIFLIKNTYSNRI